jgi:hypothetical protein
MPGPQKEKTNRCIMKKHPDLKDTNLSDKEIEQVENDSLILSGAEFSALKKLSKKKGILRQKDVDTARKRKKAA